MGERLWKWEGEKVGEGRGFQRSCFLVPIRREGALNPGPEYFSILGEQDITQNKCPHFCEFLLFR